MSAAATVWPSETGSSCPFSQIRKGARWGSAAPASTGEGEESVRGLPATACSWSEERVGAFFTRFAQEATGAVASSTLEAAASKLFLVVARAALAEGLLQGTDGFLDTIQSRVNAQCPAECAQGRSVPPQLHQALG